MEATKSDEKGFSNLKTFLEEPFDVPLVIGETLKYLCPIKVSKSYNESVSNLTTTLNKN